MSLMVLFSDWRETGHFHLLPYNFPSSTEEKKHWISIQKISSSHFCPLVDPAGWPQVLHPSGPWFSYVWFEGNISLPALKHGFQNQKRWVRVYPRETDTRRCARVTPNSKPNGLKKQPLWKEHLGIYRDNLPSAVTSISRFPSDPLWMCLFTPILLEPFISSVGRWYSKSIGFRIRPRFKSTVCHLPVMSYRTSQSLGFPIHKMGLARPT